MPGTPCSPSAVSGARCSQASIRARSPGQRRHRFTHRERDVLQAKADMVKHVDVLGVALQRPGKDLQVSSVAKGQHPARRSGGAVMDVAETEEESLREVAHHLDVPWQRPGELADEGCDVRHGRRHIGCVTQSDSSTSSFPFR